MDKQKLDKWAELLLDTGKGNNLVNFRDTKSTAVQILYPSSSEIFVKASNGNSFEVFDPKTEESEEKNENDITDQNPDIIETGLNNVSAENEYISLYRSKLKRNQILIFNRSKNPISALRYIEKKAKEYIEETGVTVAHIAFGFINWKESNYSDVVFHAPVLLIPIQIERESAVSPYTIQCSGDEIILNPTFAYKMQAEYGVQLPEYDSGSLEDYLAVIRKLLNKLNWTVSDEAKIGIFSFLKINMYKDLKENSDIILKNNNVRLLLGESPIDNGGSDQKLETQDDNPLIQLYNVVDADSSQIEAIEMAKIGKSFVLQGPPGTGKSQTITNIVAELLANGKKVLFVSEKLAALNVVYEKFKKAGLDEFCLALHSHKANKKNVINDLCSTLRTPPKGIAKIRANNDLRSKEIAQEKLDKYACEIHKKNERLGKSFYQIFEEFSCYRNAPDVAWSANDTQNKNYEFLNESSDLVKQYVEYEPSVGYDYKQNCWYGLSSSDTSYKTADKIGKALTELRRYLRNLLPTIIDINEYYHFSCESINNAENWAKFLELLGETEYLSDRVLHTDNIDFTCDLFCRLAEYGKAINESQTILHEKYRNEIINIEAEEYYDELPIYSKFITRVFNSEYKSIIHEIRSYKKDGTRVSYTEANEVVSQVIKLKTDLNEYNKLEGCILEFCNENYKGLEINWDKLVNEIIGFKDFLNNGYDLGVLKQYTYSDLIREKQNFLSYAKELKSELNENKECLSEISKYFDIEIYNYETEPCKEALEKCNSCLENIEGLNNWILFNNLLNKIKEYGILGFIDEAIAKNIPINEYENSLRKRVLFQWLDEIVSEVPELAGFNAITQNATVETFKNADKRHFEINKTRIRADLSGKRPTMDYIIPGSPTRILLREGEKKRKQKTIRNLMLELGDFIQTIKPCFLMSPLSVSTFLDPKAIHFDTVVFDEASQIFPQDAIGSIYRANQLIVVGDSKQMPPSNFFSATVDTEEYDDQAEDITDFESILDICATVLPQYSLQWHYRSKFEELIAFSNKNYYRNDLITFPSAEKKHDGVGVEFYFVEDGVFDRRNHTNRKEAEKVINLIYDHIKNHKDKSLGIVAFSIKQQDLIDRLLNTRRQKEPQFEYFFSNEKEEPFFIKNLETVQGDERDTIIFSTAYGKDSLGRIYHNFGPLNRVGGERRLNVAVTRAKFNVKLVSSMHYTDIDLSRTSSEGARLLREYLDYAENGDVALERAISLGQYEEFDSGFEQEVYDYLVSKGYSVDTQVGCSGYRIDLGVKKPDSSDYFLAIECDGATYHASKNARDRDRLRQEVLENMGWKFYRIWSTDWFRNKKVSKENLLAAVKKAESNVEIEKEHNPEIIEPENYETTKKTEIHKFKPYRMANMSYLLTHYKVSYDDYKKMVSIILQTEAPLSEDLLIRRTLSFFDREKYTSVVDEKYENAMRRCKEYGIIRKNGFLYLKDKPIEFRFDNGIHRELNQIAPEELAAGMYEILQQSKTVSKEGLFKAISELCGIKRLTSEGTTYLTAALYKIKDKIIDNEDGFITLSSK